MNIIKKYKFRILTISTVSILLLIIGVTYAWFTSNTSFTSNTFQTTDYSMDISIYESGYDVDEDSNITYDSNYSGDSIEGINEESSYIRTIINQENYFLQKMSSNYKIIEITNTSNTDFIYSIQLMFEEVGDNSIEYIKLADFFYLMTDITDEVTSVSDYTEKSEVLDNTDISSYKQVLNTVNYDGTVVNPNETIYLRFDYCYDGTNIESTDTLTINALFSGRDSLNISSDADANSYYEVSDYSGLISAIENVADDGTIILQKNIVAYNTNLTINKRITLDLNGFDLEIQGNLTFDYYSTGDASVLCDDGSKLKIYGNLYILTPATYFRFLGDGNDNLLMGAVVNGKVTGGEIVVNTRYDSQFSNRGLYMNSVQAKKITTSYEYNDLANMQLTDYSYVVIGSNSEIGTISSVTDASKIAIVNYGDIEEIDLRNMFELEVAINQIYIKNYLSIDAKIELPSFSVKFDNTRIIQTVNASDISVNEANSEFQNVDIELDGYSGDSVVYLGNNEYQINKFDDDEINALWEAYLVDNEYAENNDGTLTIINDIDVDKIYIYTYESAEITQSGLSELLDDYDIPNVDLTQTKMEDNTIGTCLSSINTLESIALPSTITSIDSDAFSGCTSLDTIIFDGDIETIGAAAFPSDITLLVYWMDENIENLHSHIEASKFPTNTNYFLELTSSYEYLKAKYTVYETEFFHIYPKYNYVAYDENDVIYYVNLLTTLDAEIVYVDTDFALDELTNIIPEYVYINGTKYAVSSISTHAYYQSLLGTDGEYVDVSFYSSYKTIGDYAFYQEDIAKLSLANVVNIGSYAFYGCEISNIDTSESTSMDSIGAYAFATSKISGSIELSGGKIGIYLGSYAFYNADLSGLSSIELLEISTISDNVFDSTILPKSLTIKGFTSDKLTYYLYLYSNVFNNTDFTNLVDLTIGDKVYLDLSTVDFTSCSLDSLTIGTGSYIAEDCFNNVSFNDKGTINLNGVSVINSSSFKDINLVGGLTLNLMNVSTISSSAFSFNGYYSETEIGLDIILGYTKIDGSEDYSWGTSGLQYGILGSGDYFINTVTIDGYMPESIGYHAFGSEGNSIINLVKVNANYSIPSYLFNISNEEASSLVIKDMSIADDGVTINSNAFNTADSTNTNYTEILDISLLGYSTTIKSNAFAYTTIYDTSIVFEDLIIKENGFSNANFVNLASIDLTEVDSISQAAFADSIFGSLELLNISNSANYQVDSLFENTIFTSLSTLTISDAVTLSSNMFYGAIFTDLSSLDLNECIVGESSFSNADLSSLESIDLSGVTVNKSGFSGTKLSAITTLDISETIFISGYQFSSADISSVSNIVFPLNFSMPEYFFSNCDFTTLVSNESFKFDFSGMTIGSYAFSSVIFKDTYTLELSGAVKVSEYAFYNLKANYLTIDLTDTASVMSNAFSSISTKDSYIKEVIIGFSNKSDANLNWGSTSIGIFGSSYFINNVSLVDFLPNSIDSNLAGVFSNLSGSSVINNVDINSDVVSTNLFRSDSNYYLKINGISISAYSTDLTISSNSFTYVDFSDVSILNLSNISLIESNAFSNSILHSEVNISLLDVNEIESNAFDNLTVYQVTIGFTDIKEEETYKWDSNIFGDKISISILSLTKYLPLTLGESCFELNEYGSFINSIIVESDYVPTKFFYTNYDSADSSSATIDSITVNSNAYLGDSCFSVDGNIIVNINSIKFDSSMDITIGSYAFSGVDITASAFSIENLIINEYGFANVKFSGLTAFEVLEAQLIKSNAFDSSEFSVLEVLEFDDSTLIFDGIAHFRNVAFTSLSTLTLTGAFVTSEYMFYEAHFYELGMLTFSNTISEYTFASVEFSVLSILYYASADIYSYAFKGAVFSGLITLTLYAESNYIGTNHFDSVYFTKLQSLTLSSGMTLPTSFFSSATFEVMTAFQINEINVGTEAFGNVNFNSLAQIFLTDSVFASRVFYNALFFKLTSLNLSNTSISDSIFTNVQFAALQSLILDGATVGASTFSGATFDLLANLQLTSTNLSEEAFANVNFTSLTTFTIDKDSTIMASAFSNAVFTKLTTLTIKKDTSFSSSVFKGAQFLALITLELEDSLFVKEEMFAGAVFSLLETLDVSNISLDEKCFYGASFLSVTEFNLTNTVFYGENIFAYSEFDKLVNLTFDATKDISYLTFYDVSFDSLEKIYIDNNSTFIGNVVFEYDDLQNVESIEFASNSTVEPIFAGLLLSSLEELKIGEGSTISESAFRLTVFGDNVSIMLNGVTRIYDYAFSSITAQGATIDLQNIPFIGAEAFSSTSTISKITIGFDSISVSNSSRPQDSYLWGNSEAGVLWNINISSLIIQNNLPEYLGENPLGNIYSVYNPSIVFIDTLTITSNVVSNNLFYWSAVNENNYININNLTVENATSIGTRAFVGVYIANEASFDFDDAASIGEEAVYLVYGNNINITARNVVSIGERAFYSSEDYNFNSLILGLDELKNNVDYQYDYIIGGYIYGLTIDGYLPDLADGSSAMYEDNQISNLTFTDQTSIGNNFFSGVIVKNSTSTSCLTFEGNNTVGDYSFYKAYINGDVEGISNITYFGEGAFEESYFNRLTKISISDNTYIGEKAFYCAEFKSVTTIYIGDNVILSTSAFEGAKMEDCYYIRIASVDIISENAFYGVEGGEIIDVDIESCEYIESGAFYSKYFRYISILGNRILGLDGLAFYDESDSELLALSISRTGSVPAITNYDEVGGDYKIYVSSSLYTSYLVTDGWEEENVKEKLLASGSSSSTNYVVEWNNEEDGLAIIGYFGTEEVVVIPDSLSYDGVYVDVVYIKAYAFNSDTIETITLSDNIKYFDSTAFSGSNISEISVPETNGYFSQIDGVIYNHTGSELVYYPAYLTDSIFVTDESVLSIANYAINNEYLKTIVLTNINKLADYAFSYASNLKEFILLSDTIIQVTSYAVFNQLYIEQTVGKVTTKVRNEEYSLYVPQYMMEQYLELDMVYYNIFNFASNIENSEYYAIYNNFDYIKVEDQVFILSYILPDTNITTNTLEDNIYTATISIPTEIDGISNISLIGNLYVVLDVVYDEINITSDVEIGIKLYSYIKNGTIISGFYSDEDKSIEIDTLVVGTTSTAVYIKSALSIHTITFNTNATTYIASITLEYGSELTVAYLLYNGIIPTRTNAKFAGWYLDEALTIPLDAVTIDDDITLYAAWTSY